MLILWQKNISVQILVKDFDIESWAAEMRMSVMADKKKIGVLIVDDTLMMRQILKKIIETGPFEVIGESTTGEDALVKFRALKPAIICLDINLPKMNGLDVLREVKQESPNQIVVMVSGDDDQQIVTKCLENGAGGYIVKPLNQEKVIKELVLAIKKSQGVV